MRNGGWGFGESRYKSYPPAPPGRLLEKCRTESARAVGGVEGNSSSESVLTGVPRLRGGDHAPDSLRDPEELLQPADSASAEPDTTDGN